MNHTPDDLGHFEQRLLTELRAEISATPVAAPKHNLRRYVLAGAAAAAAVVTGVGVPTLVGHGSSQAAFAVETAADGRVEVTIYRIDDADGLQQGLEAKGIDAVVDYVPDGKACRQPRFTPAPPSRARVDIVLAERGSGGGSPHSVSFELDPATFTGHTLVVELSGDVGDAPILSDGGVHLGVATGAVQPCVLVDAPSS